MNFLGSITTIYGFGGGTFPKLVIFLQLNATTLNTIGLISFVVFLITNYIRFRFIRMELEKKKLETEIISELLRFRSNIMLNPEKNGKPSFNKIIYNELFLKEERKELHKWLLDKYGADKLTKLQPIIDMIYKTI